VTTEFGVPNSAVTPLIVTFLLAICHLYRDVRARIPWKLPMPLNWAVCVTLSVVALLPDSR